MHPAVLRPSTSDADPYSYVPLLPPSNGYQTMPIPITLEQELNQAIFGVHQQQDLLKRQEAADELIEHLERIVNDLRKIKREALE